MDQVHSKTWLTKLISIILCVAMVLSFSSFSKAFAGDGDVDTEQGESEQKETSSVEATNSFDTGLQGDGSITVKDAIEGYTYKLYRLFDVKSTADKSGTTYFGTIPEDLTTYFNYVVKGDTSSDIITPKNQDNSEVYSEEEISSAVTNWIKSETPKTNPGDYLIYTATSVSTGDLVFDNLTPGYYAMMYTSPSDSTVNSKAAVTLTTANSTINIFSKTSTPAPINGALKTIVDEKEGYTVGDTITYQIQFNAVNVDQNVEDGKQAQIVKYVVSDVKPEFLEDMRITKIAVTEEKKGTTVLYTDVTYPNGVYHDQSMKFDDDGNYTIQWATYNDENNFWEALYSNNSVVTLWVTAEVNEYITKADAELGRIKRNTAKVTWYTSGTPDNPYLKGGSIDGEADIDMTNIVGFRKVNQDGEPLSGAEFQISGVTVNDVKPVYGTDDLEELQGVYIIQKTPQVKSTVNGSLGGGVQTDDAELFTFKTNEDGYLILVGLSSEYSDVVFTEVKAPDGYNKLTESKTFPIIKGTTLSAEFVTLNVDMDPGKECYHTTYPTQTGNGNHWVRAMQYLESADNLEAAIDDYGYTVINKKGILLPATGGMGVTALYVIGGLMIVGAGTALVVRRRRKL